MKLRIGHTELSLQRPVVMTIINVTPDSFYEKSRTRFPDEILNRAEQAISDGAAILDIGGYSSRPGAADVPAEEEFRRIATALEPIRKKFPDIPISIDTFRAEVLEQVLSHFGPCMANDITAASADPRIAEVAALNHLPFVAMHMRGTPQNMQSLTQYDDFLGEIRRYFFSKIDFLRRSGIEQIILDPGFGFSKTVEQNFFLLNNLSEVFKEMGCPILSGISRKSMIYKTLDTTPDQALTGTIALHWECLRQGSSILRVHDTREAAQVIRLYEQFVSSQKMIDHDDTGKKHP